MSKTHGDTARFHRLRKQNIARRLMVRQLREKLILAATEAAKTVKPEPAPEPAPGPAKV